MTQKETREKNEMLDKNEILARVKRKEKKVGPCCSKLHCTVFVCYDSLEITTLA